MRIYWTRFYGRSFLTIRSCRAACAHMQRYEDMCLSCRLSRIHPFSCVLHLCLLLEFHQLFSQLFFFTFKVDVFIGRFHFPTVTADFVFLFHLKLRTVWEVKESEISYTSLCCAPSNLSSSCSHVRLSCRPPLPACLHLI